MPDVALRALPAYASVSGQNSSARTISRDQLSNILRFYDLPRNGLDACQRGGKTIFLAIA
jgi:hypothetical protein